MGIVIDHCNSVNFSHPREAAIDALKTLQAIADSLRAHTQMERYGHRRQSIRDIVITRHWQGAIGNHPAIAQRHVKISRPILIGKIDSPHIGLGIEPVGHDPAIGNATNQSLHFGVICVADSQTIKWDIMHKFEEALAQIVETAPMLHMLGINIGNHGYGRRQAIECAVTFIRLDDHPFSQARAGIGFKSMNDTAVHHRRIKSARMQQG